MRVLRPDVPFPPLKAAILSNGMDLENLIRKRERSEERQLTRGFGWWFGALRVLVRL